MYNYLNDRIVGIVFDGTNVEDIKRLAGDKLHSYKQNDVIHYVITTSTGDLHVEPGATVYLIYNKEFKVEYDN